MESEIQAQIPGIDHVISEYSVVSPTRAQEQAILMKIKIPQNGKDLLGAPGWR